MWIDTKSLDSPQFIAKNWSNEYANTINEVAKYQFFLKNILPFVSRFVHQRQIDFIHGKKMIVIWNRVESQEQSQSLE